MIESAYENRQKIIENFKWHAHCQYVNRLSINSFINQETMMSKQVITANGEQHLVREDTAKSFRGTYWALASVAAFVIITAILFLSGALASLMDGSVDSPATIERQTSR